MSQPTLPIAWVVVDGIGVLLLAAGLFGLIGAPEGALAVLGQPMLAWTLIAVGAALAGAALLMIVTSLVAQQKARTGGNQR